MIFRIYMILRAKLVEINYITTVKSQIVGVAESSDFVSNGRH
jgi:hypothetical protein